MGELACGARRQDGDDRQSGRLFPEPSRLRDSTSFYSDPTKPSSHPILGEGVSLASLGALGG